jgi:sugar transferase (PEP-CTERM/EpsH1 system associated)
MKELLFLTQRIPFPPIKGEKIRALQILRFLRERYIVHLGSLIDDSTDWQYVPELKKLCGETYFAPLNPRVAKIKCLRGLLNAQPLSVVYFYNRRLAAWIDDLLARRRPAAAVVFSSAMAQYLLDARGRPRRTVMDFVDVDSDKWRQYAERHRWPMRWIYGRESRTLLAFDREVGRVFDVSTFVSSAEAALFNSLAPELASKTHYVPNGVDSDYFSPDRAYENPYSGRAPRVVFTGAMNYWPNVDAVTWFAAEILPRIRLRIPDVEFDIVGASPDPKVQELVADPRIKVTGRVPDIRPYIAHAAVAVAPLRVAGGVQNKVLEAMAMAKPVVASPRALAGLEPEAARHVFVAEDTEAFARVISQAIVAGANTEIGAQARRCILELYDWRRNLTAFASYLEDGSAS